MKTQARRKNAVHLFIREERRCRKNLSHRCGGHEDQPRGRNAEQEFLSSALQFPQKSTRELFQPTPRPFFSSRAHAGDCKIIAIVHFSPVQKRNASLAFPGAKLEFRFDAGIPGGILINVTFRARDRRVYLRFFYLPRGTEEHEDSSGLKGSLMPSPIVRTTILTCSPRMRREFSQPHISASGRLVMSIIYKMPFT